MPTRPGSPSWPDEQRTTASRRSSSPTTSTTRWPAGRCSWPRPATSTLRIGSYVYNNDLRHPAVLAKEAATIDVLSDGRLELGIGAGWNREEYDQAGLAFDPPRTRVDRMEEGLGIIEALFAGGPVHHEGPHSTG